MKRYYFFFLILLGTSLAMTSCGNKPDTTTATETPVTATDGQTPPQDGGIVIPADPNAAATQQPALGANGEAHYKCTKAGCAGTGAAQGKCPICGSDLAHNPAYHNNPPSTGSNTAATTAPQEYPAKNAKGVFHWKCTKAGCAGGGSEAGKCSICGSDLAHNQDYHTQ